MTEAAERRPEPFGAIRWSIEDVPVEAIHDRRWRADVDVSSPVYRALRWSIGELGLVRPLVVRPRPEGGYELVRGARRLRAVRDLGWPAVPAVVRELTELEALVGGAWQPLMRSGCTEREAVALRDQLVTGGMSAAEARALTAILDFRPPAETEAPAVPPARPAWAWGATPSTSGDPA